MAVWLVGFEWSLYILFQTLCARYCLCYKAPPATTIPLSPILVFYKQTLQPDWKCRSFYHVFACNYGCPRSVVGFFIHKYHNRHSFWNEPAHDKTNKMTCAPSEDSDQPGNPPSLIRIFAVRSVGSPGPKASSAKSEDWSVWTDAQNELKFCWAHVILLVLSCTCSNDCSYSGNQELLRTQWNGKMILGAFNLSNAIWCWLQGHGSKRSKAPIL